MHVFFWTISDEKHSTNFLLLIMSCFVPTKRFNFEHISNGVCVGGGGGGVGLYARGKEFLTIRRAISLNETFVYLLK